MVISKTLFDKSTQKKCTYSTKKTYELCKPWTKEMFGGIDLFLTKQSWTNIIKDVEATPHYAFSDHVVVTADVKIKLRAQYQDLQLPIKRYRNPEDAQAKLYNYLVQQLFDSIRHWHPELSATICLMYAVAQAA